MTYSYLCIVRGYHTVTWGAYGTIDPPPVELACAYCGAIVQMRRDQVRQEAR